MKYLLTFIVDQRTMVDSSEEEMKEAMERWSAFDREAVEAGAMIACDPLQDSSTATTFELTGNGERITTDGPFAESKEQLGGFCLLDCRDENEALEWAGKVPMQTGFIEVRPILDLSGYGYQSPTPAPVNAAA
ncbi:MAG: YciI family protein [Actinomycetota bacterium]|nr:YciI family protein [Actinomycetota bacterium]